MTGPRITDVERMVLHVPFTPRCDVWNSLLVWRWGLVELVRVETDVGATGFGESLLHYGWHTGGTTDNAVERVRGANPAEFLGNDSLGPSLQIAIYDVIGKILEVPVHDLFPNDQVRQRCPIAWWNTKMPPEALAAEARDARAAGYVYHKFKARPWFDVYEQIEQISAVTPPSYRLDIDWNAMLLSAGEAASVLRELDRYERTSIYETPIPHGDFEGYQQLRGKVTKPLAAHFNAQPFPAGVRSELVDGYVVTGGAQRTLRHGALCAEFGKNFWLQNVGLGITTAFNTHLGSVLTHARWPAVTALNNFADDLLMEPLAVNDGLITVPTGPGLGVQVDEAAIVKYRVDPSYDIPEPRHILTVKWASGRTVHYARMRQCWDDFLAGNHPVQERGATMEIHRETEALDPQAWNELYDRARKGPVHDRQGAV